MLSLSVDSMWNKQRNWDNQKTEVQKASDVMNRMLMKSLVYRKQKMEH